MDDGPSVITLKTYNHSILIHESAPRPPIAKHPYASDRHLPNPHILPPADVILSSCDSIIVFIVHYWMYLIFNGPHFISLTALSSTMPFIYAIYFWFLSRSPCDSSFCPPQIHSCFTFHGKYLNHNVMYVRTDARTPSADTHWIGLTFTAIVVHRSLLCRASFDIPCTFLSILRMTHFGCQNWSDTIVFAGLGRHPTGGAT